VTASRGPAHPWSRRRNAAAAAVLLVGALLPLCVPSRVAVDPTALYVDFLCALDRETRWAAEVIVVEEETVVFPLDRAMEDHVRWASLHGKLPGLRREVYDDFWSANRTPVTLALVSAGAMPVRLLPLEEKRRYFVEHPGDGWGLFWDTHPRAQGVMQLSRPGFSRDGLQALLYSANAVSGTGGGGSYYLLSRESGTWTVVCEALRWQS
jgi:hypothetical protein